MWISGLSVAISALLFQFAKGDVIFLNAYANFSLAESLCTEKQGELPLPSSEAENQDLAVTLASHGIKQTWLNTHLSLYPWINRESSQIVTNQGCFSGDTFEEAFSIRSFDATKCRNSCNLRSAKYYGIKKTATSIVTEIACMCGSDLKGYKQASQSLCPYECKSFGRDLWCASDRFHTGIYLVQDGGYVNQPWHVQEGSEITAEDTCGKFTKGSRDNSTLEKFNCSTPLDVYCISNIGGAKLHSSDKLSWFAGESYCKEQTSHLPDLSESKAIIDSLADGEEIWTSITARHWKTVDEDNSERIEFSNWSKEGTYTSDNTCASVSSFGNWLDQSCENKLESFICITNTPDEVITKTTTTTTTTTTTAPTTTKSPGQGGGNTPSPGGGNKPGPSSQGPDLPANTGHGLVPTRALLSGFCVVILNIIRGLL